MYAVLFHLCKVKKPNRQNESLVIVVKATNTLIFKKMEIKVENLKQKCINSSWNWEVLVTDGGGVRGHPEMPVEFYVLIKVLTPECVHFVKISKLCNFQQRTYPMYLYLMLQ